MTRAAGPKQNPPGVTKAVASVVALAKEAEFISPWITAEDIDAYIVGTVFADKAGTLHIEQSSDGVNVDVDESFEVPANDGKGFTEDRMGSFWRVRYVNGAVAQGAFRLAASAKRGG
jgi:hypothetical protein